MCCSYDVAAFSSVSVPWCGVVMVGTGNEIIVIRDDLVTPRCIGIRAVRVCKGYGGDAVQRGTRNG